MVAVFMVVVFRLPRCGGGDPRSPFPNALFTWRIYALIPVPRSTLPGIAGFHS